jgi:putative MATE family efflux protein
VSPTDDPVLRRGPFFAVLLQGLPLAIGLASHAVINLVDLGMVGRLGDDAVQSAHVATTWNFLPMIVGQVVSTALLAQLSQQLGRGDVDGARRRNVRAQVFMVWLGLALGVASALPAALQVDAVGVTGAVRSEALHYLIVSNLGCLPMFVMMQTTAAMRAAGEAIAPLCVLLGANVINLGLDVVLLFGWPQLGIPSVGVVGAAYASVVSRSIAAGFAIWWLRRPGHALPWRRVTAARDGDGGELAVVAPLLRDAWPQAVQIVLRALVVVALTVIVQQHFGDDVTVSLGVTTRLDTLVLFSSLGFASAATAYAGRAVPVGLVWRARLAGVAAAVQSMAFGATFVWFYTAECEVVLRWFLPEPSPVTEHATGTYFGIAAWSQVLGAGALGAIGAVQGAGFMRAPMVVDLVAFALAGALLWAAAQTDSMLADYYRVLVVGMAIVAVLQLALVLFGRWARAAAPEDLSA